MASQSYEEAMRREARSLIAAHGELVEVRCLSGPPQYRIELLFADGHEEIITRHSGRVDISMMKFGYAGTGTQCFWAFLDEAGFQELTLEQLQTMQGPQVFRHDRPAEEAVDAGTEPTGPERSRQASGEAGWPLWREVARDPSLLDPLVLQRLEKSMCVMVQDETGPVAALVVRASPDELRGPLTEGTPMSLYIHAHKMPTFDFCGIYPMIWDDPADPFFKETWIVGAGSVSGPSDPLIEDQLSRLESLLTQEYTYFLLVDRSNQVVAARQVPYTPATQEHFLALLPAVRGARGKVISNTEFISGVADYMNRVPLEDVRQSARRLMGLETTPRGKEPLPAIPVQPREEHVYPWRGQSKLRRAGTALLGLIWFFFCSWASGMTMAMQGVEPNWLLYGGMLFFVLGVPISCLIEALRPTRIREIVVSPQKGLLFRRKSGEEKPIFAQVTLISEPQLGKRLLLRGRSPAGKNVKATIDKSNLQGGDWERLKQDLRTFAPQAKREAATRRVWLRRVVAALCSIPATLALLGALFVGASLAYDQIQGTTSIPISPQAQTALSLGLLVAFVAFAAVSTVVSDRRLRVGAVWAVLFVVGVAGAGAIVVGITGGEEEGGEPPIVAPLVTPSRPALTPTPGTPFADQIVAYNPGTAQNPQYADPGAVIGGPDLVEQPCCSGMLQLGAGGSLLLAFVDNAIYDETGPDFQIFGESARDDFIVVEVSADGQVWRSYPKTSECPEPFDLADVGLKQALLVRITDVQPGTVTGAELDAVEALHTGSPLGGGLPENMPDALARSGFALREGPAEDSYALSEVPASSPLAVHECTEGGTWVLVSTTDGQSGWCTAAELALNVSLADYKESTLTAGSTPVPSPSTPAVSMELGQALAASLAQATVTGQGLERIDLLLQSLSEDPLKISIPAGTTFLAQTAGTQNMVVRKPATVLLPAAGSKQSVTLSAACASMELDAPQESDSFTVSTAPVPEDLIKLLNLAPFLDEPFRVQQFAIWTITDNPPRGGYVGLGYFGIGSGPSDEEMERIRTLFQQAGISTEPYQALN